uniref:Alpha-mann_mid domain-containing protein n=1 Tax=Rhabditophanes sp. KR3021 TaxID=114890 RepID=A0AC35TT36_9BILA
MLLLYSILIGLFFGLGRSHTCSWKNCPNVDASEGVINVHIVPHTHDDLGWIKTVDEYFFGTNNHLVPVGVNYIFDSVIDSLHKDPSRKFSFAETGFLWRWMETHDDKQKQRFTNLLNNGQIEIIGGGFVQNDEASAHYVDIIDQMTLGLRYLNETFGECGKPKVAWQIDPFGHSIEMASIFSQMDYEALYFAREHYLEHKQRIQDKTLEFIWNSSQDLKTSILTGVFYLSTYAPLKDFCFDSLCQDDSIIDNKNFPGYNLDVKLKAFIEHIYKQVSVQRHNNILFSAGGDFQYSDANHWFVNLDKLIYHVQKQFPNIKIFYSTPSCYIQSLKSFKPNLTTKTSDFFPYAHRNNTYWTGYFTSKPTQKRMIRQSSTLNNLIKKLSAVTRLNNSPQTLMSKKLQRASALNQHHDAVT